MTKLKSLSLFVLTLILPGAVGAQGKYGATPADSVECVKNISLYQEFMRQPAYADAYPFWREVVRYCPGSSKAIYQNGAKMLVAFIGAETNAERRQQLMDSLYMVYDMRITYFGEKAFVLGRKAGDMLNYSPDRCKDAFDTAKESVDLAGAKSEAVALLAYYQALTCMYNSGEATKDQMLSDYVLVNGHIEANLEREDLKELDRNDYLQARDYVNGQFFKVAECADIGRIVEDMLQAKPNDAELKTRLLKVLNGKDCTEEKVYRTLAEDVHRANPSSESAYSLGMNLVKRNDLAGAAKFLKESVDLCNGCADKAKYLLKAGQVASATGNHGTARSYANQLLQIEPKNGEALILIGDAISAQASSCEKPDSWGVYWLAYDYYQRAKSLDASVADKAGERASRTHAHFPTQSDAFFHQLTDGQTIQVSCGGLNESTTVRTRK